MNARVRKNVATDTAVLPIAEAKQAGAIAFFGEKYGDTVRVVTMGESKEFCGGTHVARTGDIALFKITEETGIAQGVRRIEAATGAGALGYVRKMEGELLESGRLLRAGEFEVAARIAKLQADQRALEKEIEKLRRKLASGGGRDLLSEARDVDGVRVLATRADVADPKALREVADQLRDKLGSGVIVLAGVEGDKIALVAMVSPDLVGKHHAGKIVGEVAKAVGRQGGRPAGHGAGGRLGCRRARRGAGARSFDSRPWLTRRPDAGLRARRPPTRATRWPRRCGGASPARAGATCARSARPAR